MDDRELYDRAAARHPTTFLVDPAALKLAGELFGPDPDLLPGSWMDGVFRYIDPVLAAQHTYTPRCDGHHAPGPCPPEGR